MLPAVFARCMKECEGQENFQKVRRGLGHGSFLRYIGIMSYWRMAKNAGPLVAVKGEGKASSCYERYGGSFTDATIIYTDWFFIKI